jgi:MFS family permease
MPLEIGGFNLDPPQIGWIIGIYGTWTAIFQALYFSRMVDYLGVRKLFILSISMYLIIFLSLPAINIAALMFGKYSILVGFSPFFFRGSSDLGFGIRYVFNTKTRQG